MTFRPTERHAMVIGAGLAGAAVCAALARRHWKITLLDAATGAAQGASSLPVGMLSPHVTRAPTPLSRLSVLGEADTRAELQRLVLRGAGWQPCEVDNLGHNPGRWPAALVRPAALVQAWLNEAALQFELQTIWTAPVARLEALVDMAGRHTGWKALGPQGNVIAQAPVVVVAAAFGSLALLKASAQQDAQSLPLRPVQGQMSFAELTDEPSAPRPRRDNGVFVPCYEDTGLSPRWPTRIWAMGSTYVRGFDSCDVDSQAHERNATSLDALAPPAAERLRQAMAQGDLLGWAQVRCASLDRLPLVGAVPDLLAMRSQLDKSAHPRGRLRQLETVPRWPGLYMLSALGSRGLTLAHWCARQLALMMDGEPPQVSDQDQDLIPTLDPARFAWRVARRQPLPAAALGG